MESKSIKTEEEIFKEFDLKIPFIKEYGQDHLLEAFKRETSFVNFAKEIISIDLKVLKELHNLSSKTFEDSKYEFSPIPDPFPLSAQTPEKRKELWDVGLSLIAENKCGVLIMAGGQASRLNFEHPKGKFVPDIPSKQSLYQIFARRIISLKKLSGSSATLPLAIMTSDINHQETVSYFEENSFFGLDRENVFFFTQGSLPALTFDGKIILSNFNEISKCPNGNGDVYDSFNKAGLLDLFISKGVEYVNLVSVDNLLSPIGDPRFLAFAFERKAKIASKYLERAGPQEKVGVHGIKAGKPTVIEYSELTIEESSSQDENGKLKFSQSNICNTMISLSFLKGILTNSENYSLLISKYHLAKKKIEYWSIPDQEIKKPTENNCHKFELFYFNLFELADKIEIMEVERCEEFAPIKNATGVDSPFTAIELFSNRNRRWLAKYNVKIEGDGVVDIDPLLSYNGENLEYLENSHVVTPIYISKSN